MVSETKAEKNVVFAIKKISEPIDEFIKEVHILEREHRKSDESSANISRKACQQFLDEARLQIGKFEGFKGMVAQAVESLVEKLSEQKEVLTEKLNDSNSEIKDLKSELKKAQQIAENYKSLPDKFKRYIDAETPNEK